MIYDLNDGTLQNDTLSGRVSNQVEEIEKRFGTLPEDDRTNAELALAAALCERCAYRNARRWPANLVGQLIDLAARLQRLLPAALRESD